jgi:solute carrier family 13 (sodium-dependent dicarboxylate transporter), member 2/3/5
MHLKKTGLVLGLSTPVAIVLFCEIDGNPQMTRMAAVAAMMSILWITEAIPLAATALLPLGLFPVLGIASSQSTATQYMNSIVFLLIGGFMIALAMQRWHLHKRIALNVLALFGGQPTRMLLGFMLATAGLSMWISNTATTLMMLPIALAIVNRYEGILSEQQQHRFTVGLLLAIAYSASIGGMMTLVGTAPNLVFARFYEMSYGQTIGFAQWMLLAVPTGIVLLLILALLIDWILFRKLPRSEQLKQLVINEKTSLGKIRYEEKAVLFVFSVTALLWITRKGLQIGGFSFQGWNERIAFGKMIDDGSVAIVMATILFFIPAKLANGDKTTILNEEVFAKLPWAIVLLFGGGFALAYGFAESGLSAYLASQLTGLKSVSLPIIIFSVTAGMSLLTELTSNTATTQLVMPILQSAAEVIDVTPVWLMLPATLAASCAFMFPVATPPNAIVFGSGKLKVMEMVKLGVFLNIISIILISLMCFWLVPLVFTLTL